MKGDKVVIVVDTGGATREFTIEARSHGRTVEVMPAQRGVIEVIEKTRTGREIRTARFMAARVVAMVDEPA